MEGQGARLQSYKSSCVSRVVNICKYPAQSTHLAPLHPHFTKSGPISLPCAFSHFYCNWNPGIVSAKPFHSVFCECLPIDLSASLGRQCSYQRPVIKSAHVRSLVGRWYDTQERFFLQHVATSLYSFVFWVPLSRPVLRAAIRPAF